MSSAPYARGERERERERDFRDRDRDRDRERDRDFRDRDRERDQDRRGPAPGARGPFGPGPDGPRGPPPFARGPPPPIGFRGGPPPRERDAIFRRPDGAGPHAGPIAARMAPPAEPFTVDREKICPLLIRVFIKPGSHHRLEDFAVRGKEPGGDAEIQIYTWMDATLRELSDLVKEVKPAARGRMTRLSFAFVYPDKRGRNVMRQVGLVHSTRPGEDDNKTLKALQFQTGDFLDVAIL